MLALGRFGVALGLLTAALLSTSCNTTPTLPLPPPVANVGVPDEQGFALIEGQAQEEAYVSVLNETSTEGVITKADTEGMFKTKIAAKSGDRLTLWQTVDGETSELKHTVVPEPR